MKIFQYLQIKGISRRKCIQLIKDGAVFVNDKKVESFNQELENLDKLIIDNGELKINVVIDFNLSNPNLQGYKIVLFNKPKGYVVSKEDKHNKTIFEILPQEFKEKYYYIGRLDKDSHGLLILTSDPRLVNEYEHPKYGIIKEYVVQVDKEFSKSDVRKSLFGIMDDGDNLKFKTVKYNIKNGKHLLNILLNEGKKRHIRRVLKSLGYKVIDLMRIREGEFELADLKEGEFKFI